MEITIIVNMDDIFQEDEQTIDEAIKSQIIWQVKKEVLESIKDKVDDQILKELKVLAGKEYEIQVRQEVQKVIENGFVPGTESKDRPEGKRIVDWIASQFNQHQSWNSPKSYLEKKADLFAKEMKTRYDHSFASQVVLKLNQQGLLKDGVIESLMENKS